MIWMFFTSILLSLPVREFELKLNGIEFKQSETIRLEVTRMDQECSVLFNGITYPLYQLDSSKVALIGLPADFPTGSHVLELSGESTIWKKLIQVKPTACPRENIVFPPEKASLVNLDISEERNVIRSALRRESDRRFWDTVFTKPVDGRISSPYGARRNRGYHRGMDIAAPTGSIVRTPAGGTVTVARNFPIHGKTVVLDHGQGVSTIYCHLDTILVEEGEFVKNAFPLGKAGNTGRTTASHLHWGLYIHAVSVDPYQWLLREY